MTEPTPVSDLPYADALTGPWRLHPQTPALVDQSGARPGEKTATTNRFVEHVSSQSPLAQRLTAARRSVTIACGR